MNSTRDCKIDLRNPSRPAVSEGHRQTDIVFESSQDQTILLLVSPLNLTPQTNWSHISNRKFYGYPTVKYSGCIDMMLSYYEVEKLHQILRTEPYRHIFHDRYSQLLGRSMVILYAHMRGRRNLRSKCTIQRLSRTFLDHCILQVDVPL